MRSLVRFTALCAAMFVTVYTALTILELIADQFGVFWVWVIIIGTAFVALRIAQMIERYDR